MGGGGKVSVKTVNDSVQKRKKFRYSGKSRTLNGI